MTSGLTNGSGTHARSSERGAFGALVLLYLALSFLVFNQIEEDAFIYFRLVGNLAHGYGLVFNRGGEPVEAGSSPLWMFLLLLFWKAPLDIVITAKLLGLAAGCVSLWLVLCISRVHIPDPVLRFGPPLLTAASTPFLMWSQRGLETPLFALIVLWLALCCTDPRRFRWWPVPGVLLLPARPEGFLFLLALIPALGFDRGRWRAASRSILVVAVAAIGLLTARFLYFHDLVPSPFYVKLHTAGGVGLYQVAEYARGNHLLVLGIPFLLVAWRRSFWTPPRIVLAGFILITATWCALAKDYMPYVRHLLPAIPLVYVLLLAAADTTLSGLGTFRRPGALGYIAAAFVVTLFFSRSGGYFGSGGGNEPRMYIGAFAADPGTFVRATAAKIRSPTGWAPLDEAMVGGSALVNYQGLVGEFLRRNYPADSLVIYDQMGQTPFYAGSTMQFIDTLGLTDRTIGRFYFEAWKRSDALLRFYDAVNSHAVKLAFGERRDEITETKALNYLFGLNPDLILLNGAVMIRNPVGISARMGQDPRLGEGYELRYTLANVVLVYERKDSPRKQYLDVPAGLPVVPR